MNRLLDAFRPFVILVCMFVLSACGGGGGGGSSSGSGGSSGGGSTPPPVADTANSYLPTDLSIRWAYNGDTQVYFSADTVSNNVHVHSLLYPTGGKEYFVTATDQISLQGLYLPSITVGDGVVYTGDIKFNNLLAVFRSDWLAGSSQSVNGAGTINIAPTYGNRAINFSGNIIYVGDEVVSTALGSFTAKRVNINITVTTVVDGYSFAIPYNVTFWFAKDAGIVKREQSSVTYLLTSVSGIDVSGATTTGSGTSGTGTGIGTGTGTGAGIGTGTGTGAGIGTGTGTGAGAGAGTGTGTGTGVAQTTSIAASSTGLSFVVHVNASSASQNLVLTFAGDAVVVDSQPYWLNLVANTSVSATTQTYSILATSTYLTAGTYNSSVRFKTARIPPGGNINQASDVAYVNVPVTVVVSDFALSAQAINLSAVDGGSTVQQGLGARSFTLSGTSLSWNVSSDQAWLTFTQTTGSGPATVSFNIASSGLGLGAHTANISVQNTNTGEVLTLPVTVMVNAPQIVLSPQSLSYSVDGRTTNSQLSKTITVTDEVNSSDILRAVSWHIASINAAWISSVTPSSGNSASSSVLTVALNSSAIATLADGDYSGSVVIGYTTEDMQTHTSTLPVSLHVSLPRVQWVGPDVVYAGQQFEVILRGSGFSGLANPSVFFGSTNAGAVTLISDTEIRAIYPVLAAGETQVRVANNLGLVLGGGRLFVQNAAALPAAILPSTSTMSKVFFDNERLVLYGIDRQAQSISRWTLQNNTWVALPTLLVSSIQDAAISTDGRALVIVTDGFGIYQLDLTTAGAVPQRVVQTSEFFTHIAFTNHNLAILTSDVHGSGFSPSYTYNVSSNQLTQNSYFQGWLSCPQVAASDNGRRVLIGQNCVSPEQPMKEFDASNDVLTDTPLAKSVGFFTLNRDASKFIVDGSLYDIQYNFLGYASGILSADGKRSYVYNYDINTGISKSISIFDLTVTPGAGSYFPPLTTIAISSSLVTPMDSNYYNFHSPSIAVSGDGLTMFLWGNNALQILPLP